MKILVIQQKMIGDVLTSSILFEVIKTKHPSYKLHYAINEHTVPVVLNNPYIDKLILIDTETQKNKAKFYRFLKSIKAERYDVVVDAYSKISSNLMSIFSKANIRISKYKFYTHFLYTHPVTYSKDPLSNAGLAIENRLQLLHPLFDINLKEEIVKPKIYLTKAEIEQTKTMLVSKNINLDVPIVMVSVLGSSKNKTYPLPYMAKIIDFLVKKTDMQVLFNYIPNQRNDVDKLFSLCKPHTKQNIKLDIFGKSLREFLAITKLCRALIGNEGGAVNMAKALNVPSFSIFSPWIDKKTWHTFSNKQNIAIHLNDFKPELFVNKNTKYLKQNTNKLYNAFTPELIFHDLEMFLKNLNN
ncbi:MAG: glycosyltransferase family 9 protein [Aestuariibaculum sp.]